MKYLRCLILQRCMYFDYYLNIVWTVSSGLFIYCKLDYLKIPKLLVVTAYLLMIITFSIKHYLTQCRGFTSDISKLTRLFLLTVLIQIPLVSFFLISSPSQLCTPVELCLHGFLVLMTLIESTVGFLAIYGAVQNAANHRENTCPNLPPKEMKPRIVPRRLGMRELTAHDSTQTLKQIPRVGTVR